MEVTLLECTKSPERVVWEAARVCYFPGALAELQEEYDSEKVKTFCANLVRDGHLSPFEHVVFRFYILGVSRSLLAQLTRHRLASYSVSSQHFQDHSDFVYKPLEHRLTSELRQEYMDLMGSINKFYKKLLSAKVPRWVAREVLPNSTLCNIVMTVNARELLHIIKLRNGPENTPEIRFLAKHFYNYAIDKMPGTFKEVVIHGLL